MQLGQIVMKRVVDHCKIVRVVVISVTSESEREKEKECVTR